MGAVLLNLTGPAQLDTLDQLLPGLEAAEVGLWLKVALRTLSIEQAKETLEAIAAGRIGRCILPWIPLMHGGGETSIINQWKTIAETEPNIEYRSIYAGLALVFAELTNYLTEWEKALEEWNMMESQVANRWRAAQNREDILRVLEVRFESPIPADLKAAVEALMDRKALLRLLDVAATADSLDAFRAAVLANGEANA